MAWSSSSRLRVDLEGDSCSQWDHHDEDDDGEKKGNQSKGMKQEWEIKLTDCWTSYRFKFSIKNLSWFVVQEDRQEGTLQEHWPDNEIYDFKEERADDY